MCSVRVVGGLGPGVNPPLVDDDPPLVTAKSGLEGSDLTPLGKVENLNLSLNCYKLYCQTLFRLIPKKFFCNDLYSVGCLSGILLLCLITFKQSFNEPVMFSL